MTKKLPVDRCFFEKNFPKGGHHPEWLKIGDFPESDLRKAINKVKPVAIGEIGLDYALDKFDTRIQDHALEIQIELAKEFQLPVIIHCRKAFQLLYDRLKYFPQVTGVLHAFNGGPEFAEKFLELGYYLAFGGGVIRPSAVFIPGIFGLMAAWKAINERLKVQGVRIKLNFLS